jgi:predicted nucleic acid-binding protein
LVNAFLDTSILIDVLRQRSYAANWLSSQAQLGVTPMVRMELVAGAHNKLEQSRAIQLVAKFQMFYPTQAEIDWAMQIQTIYALSHGVGMNDCLIASASIRLQLPLYTTNLKHFTPLLGSLAQRPY